MATVTKKRPPSAKRDRAAKVRSDSPQDTQERAPWHQTTFAWALAGSVLLWAAFPNFLGITLWPLAWIAPVFWLLLIRRDRMQGRRLYRSLYLAGVIHWLAVFYFVVLPHWAGYIGWVALALYLAIYLPLFVGLSRVAVHRLRVPLIVAAPVVWVGLELMRGHLFTGLAMAFLGHTQVSWTAAIQIADLFGAYAVSFAVMFVAACVATMIPIGERRFNAWPAIPLVILIGGMLWYGHARLQDQPEPAPDSRPVHVALIQGSIDTEFNLAADQRQAREELSLSQYRNLTIQARRTDPRLDLIVWPESMFPEPDYVDTQDQWQPLPHDTEAQRSYWIRAEITRQCALYVNGLKVDEDRSTGVPMLVGTQTYARHSDDLQQFNTALLIDPMGKVQDRYFKMHLVPFGEFIPFGEFFPFLYNLTPMNCDLAAGKRPRVFEVAGLSFAPNICFESTVPHVIRRQLRQLASEGNPADVMVNITNDGWFKGSNCLDLHLACTIFRAVENRTPALVAANTGFSAWIDGNGRVLEKGPRRQTGVVYCEVTADGRRSLYQRLGDIPASICLLLCGGLAVVGAGSRLLSRKRAKRS